MARTLIRALVLSTSPRAVLTQEGNLARSDSHPERGSVKTVGHSAVRPLRQDIDKGFDVGGKRVIGTDINAKRDPTQSVHSREHIVSLEIFRIIEDAWSGVL